MGIDEYQRYFYEVLSDGRTVLLDGRRPLRAASCRPPRWGSRRSRAPRGASSATSWPSAPTTATSRCSRSASCPRYEEQKLVDLDLSVRDRGFVAIDPQAPADPRGGLRGERRAQDRPGRAGRRRPCSSGGPTTREPSTAPSSRPGTASGSPASASAAATPWSPPPTRATSTTGSSPRRCGSPRSPTSPSEPITALEYVLGNITAIVGDARGNVSRLVPGPREGGGHRAALRQGPQLPGPGRRDRGDRRLHPRQELRDRRQPTARWSCAT